MMNQHTDTIAKILIGLAEYYEKQLTPLQMDMYVDDLSDIPPSELLKAIRHYRKDAKNDRFPLPAKLRSMLNATDDQNAREAVSRIITAITSIGPYRNDEAHKYVGELGWEVVKRQGGWQSIVDLSAKTDLGILQAQWRELAISLISRNRLGIMNEAPRLPNSPPQAQLEQKQNALPESEVLEQNPEHIKSVREKLNLLRPIERMSSEEKPIDQKALQDRVKFLNNQARLLEGTALESNKAHEKN